MHAVACIHEPLIDGSDPGPSAHDGFELIQVDLTVLVRIGHCYHLGDFLGGELRVHAQDVSLHLLVVDVAALVRVYLGKRRLQTRIRPVDVLCKGGLKPLGDVECLFQLRILDGLLAHRRGEFGDDDRDQKVEEHKLSKYDDSHEEESASQPHIRDLRHRLHGMHPLASERHEDGDHRRVPVVEVVVRLLEQPAGADVVHAVFGAALVVTSVSRPDRSKELHAQQGENEREEDDEDDEVAQLRDRADESDHDHTERLP